MKIVRKIKINIKNHSKACCSDNCRYYSFLENKSMCKLRKSGDIIENLWVKYESVGRDGLPAVHYCNESIRTEFCKSLLGVPE